MHEDARLDGAKKNAALWEQANTARRAHNNAVAALADDLPEGGPLAVDRASEDLGAAISRDDAYRWSAATASEGLRSAEKDRGFG